MLLSVTMDRLLYCLFQGQSACMEPLFQYVYIFLMCGSGLRVSVIVEYCNVVCIGVEDVDV